MSYLKSTKKRKNKFSKAVVPKNSQESAGNDSATNSGEQKNSEQSTPIFTRRFNRVSLTDSETQATGNPQIQSRPSNKNTDTTSGKIPISPNSFLWKKSNNLIRNIRSMPKTSDHGINSPSLGANKQISNLNDVETELELLLK